MSCYRIPTVSSRILVATIFFLGCVSAFFFDLPSYNLVRVIGIDLGTTYSRVGVYEFNGRVEIIANDQGNLNTPSWVAFTDHGQILIGEAAKDQAALNQDRTVFDVKKLLGRNFDDEQVQRVMKQVPYNIVNKDGKPYIQVKMIKDNNEMTKVFFSPEEISAMILVKMKETAEAYFGRKMKNAVLSVPAYFNEAQRQATKDAAVIAGLNVLEIINEPAAAALAYGLDKKGVVKKNIMIFDLGGGTFDVTILAIHDGVFQVLAATGDTHLGGDVFDLRIMEYFIKVIKKKHGKDISKDNRALDKLRRESERAKRGLSTKHHVRLEIESFLDGTNFSQVLTRVRFEELNNDLFRKTMGPVNKAMDEARLQKSQIDEIVLVGGSSRIPKVQQLLKEYFQGKEPNKKGVKPDEAVAYGVAIQGGILSEEEEREENSRFLWPLSPEEQLSQEEIEQMVSEAEEFASEHERINARRSLETYIYDMKNQINDKDKLAEKLESREKEKIEGAIKEASEWLVDNQSSEKDHYEEKHKKVEAVCKPIITAVYQKRPLSTIPSSHALMHML